jgi:glycine betaine catabolism A
VKVASVRSWSLPVNWKVLWEGGVECYHCAINHPEFVKVVSVGDGPPEDEVFDADPTAPYAFSSEFVGMRRDNTALTMDGQPASRVPLGLPGADLPASIAFLTKPVPPLEIVAWRDMAMARPHFPVSPSQTDMQVVLFVHEDAVEGEDYQLDKLNGLLHTVQEQDNELARVVQEGINSPAYEPGPLHPQWEWANTHFVANYLRAMEDVVPAAAA